ncbi:hypothetical protein LR48_Vigan01g305800 [Vigna angularis]|uniref:Uncharacterized protein n=1 Tax=Phaseolus angularis TaxID=3914 RepID=A0A0L9TSX6_PHAAN|nr:hypothetical protein LR48_Vigan01g305800 [Vigna angularis]
MSQVMTWKCRRNHWVSNVEVQKKQREREEEERKRKGKHKGKEEDRSRSPFCCSQLKKLKRRTRETQGYHKFRVSAHLNFFPWRLKKIEVELRRRIVSLRAYGCPHQTDHRKEALRLVHDVTGDPKRHQDRGWPRCQVLSPAPFPRDRGETLSVRHRPPLGHVQPPEAAFRPFSPSDSARVLFLLHRTPPVPRNAAKVAASYRTPNTTSEATSETLPSTKLVTIVLAGVRFVIDATDGASPSLFYPFYLLVGLGFGSWNG